MSVFRFKQFDVDQEGCAMRINTDGVLLAALATADDSPSHVLDVGTGTGVVSLMLAQRYLGATVDAIEIDREAADTAKRNFDQSPFKGRLASYAVALADFDPDQQYDLIVSNPPFFVDSLRNDDDRRGLARHTNIDFFDQLLGRAQRWLTASGRLQLILPVALAARVEQKAINDYGLVLQAAIPIRSFPGDSPIRRLLFLGKTEVAHLASPTDFVIYQRRGVYSEQYRELLRPFFLAF